MRENPKKKKSMLPEVTIVCDTVLHTVQDVARGGMCFSGVLSCTSFVYNV